MLPAWLGCPGLLSFLDQGTKNGVLASRRQTAEDFNQGGHPVVRGIEESRRHFQHRGQTFGERKGWLMGSAFVTADASACRGLVQSRQHAQTILGNALRQACFAQSPAENRGRGFAWNWHPSIIEELACAVSTNVVESAGIGEWHWLAKSPVQDLPRDKRIGL